MVRIAFAEIQNSNRVSASATQWTQMFRRAMRAETRLLLFLAQAVVFAFAQCAHIEGGLLVAIVNVANHGGWMIVAAADHSGDHLSFDVL